MSEAISRLIERFGESKPLLELVNALRGKCKVQTVGVERLAGSAFSLTAAAALRQLGGGGVVHIFVASDRDAAAYLANDLYNLGVETMFFPTAYKRSIRFGQQDASGIVQRTAVLNALQAFPSNLPPRQPAAATPPSQGGEFASGKLSSFRKEEYPEPKASGEVVGVVEFLAICTYPEALAEKVVSRNEMVEKTLTLRVGETVSMSTVEDILMDWDFARVDFVHEPGQYSIRGGIFAIFSYSAPKPYRVDFFGKLPLSYQLSRLGARTVSVHSAFIAF